MVSFSEKRRNGAQPILQKSFKGAWGQISPTSAKWLQATLLAKCEDDRVRRLASSKVGTALPCLLLPFAIPLAAHQKQVLVRTSH